MAENALTASGDVAMEELRIAGVLNGGVSLAVWMGGVAHELNRLTRSSLASPSTTPGENYQTALALTRTEAVVDVLAGTSAGGINGGALAIAQVNRSADLSDLRTLWSDQGRIQSLLRAPFQGQPTSLLRGDDYFLPELNKAMERLSGDLVDTEQHVDLIMPTTLLTGSTLETPDSLGHLMRQDLFGGRFEFRLHKPTQVSLLRISSAIALAARSSAGFPFAFEPSFIPVGDGAVTPEGISDPLRPDMTEYASWAKPGVNRSRYAIDGGVLSNTPTRQALAAIDRRPATSPVRRAMLLVFPHASQQTTEVTQKYDAAPTVAAGALGMFDALRSQGSLSFVEEVEQHNRRVSAWRGGRMDVLESLATPSRIYALVETGWTSYRRLRQRLSADTLAGRTRREGWSHERVRDQALQAQDVDPALLPYVPLEAPPSLSVLGQSPDGTPTTWPWGPVVCEGIADAVTDVLRRALSVAIVAPDDIGVPDAYRESVVLGVARDKVNVLRNDLVRAREQVDAPWNLPVTLAMAPTSLYWETRLIAFRRSMGLSGPADSVELANKFDELVQAIPTSQREQLERSIEETRAAVMALGAQGPAISATAHALAGIVSDPATNQMLLQIANQARGIEVGLGKWLPLLTLGPAPEEPAGDPSQLMLLRLLALDTATWLVASSDSVGASLPIKLVQIDLSVSHTWAQASNSPDDKAAGLSVGHFGGFLKRSWRLNDWIWGRLDAARMLSEIVLDANRLLRIHCVMHGDAADQTAAVDESVSRVMLALDGLYGPEGPLSTQGAGRAQVDALRKEALKELHSLFEGAADPPISLPNVAAFAALPVQWRIILEELPLLATAVRADRAEAQNPRSRGEWFLSEHAILLANIAADGAGPNWRQLGQQSLEAFDRAGIGREDLGTEAGSDALVQTAANAAAVGVTLLDSENFGIKAIRPFTRAVRGAALLPYWALIGLTRGNAMTRALAIAGFALGGVLLTLGLLGFLGKYSSAGTAAGAATLLVAFAYSALRTGSLLHGVILLGPVVPLAAFVVARRWDDTDARDALATVGIILAVAAGMAALGSIPWPLRSPLAMLSDRPGRTLVNAAFTVAVLGLGTAAFWGGRELMTRALEHLSFALVERHLLGLGVTVAVLVPGGFALAYYRGRRMRRWTEGAAPTLREVDQPSGVAAGWAAVYGTGYLAIAVVLALILRNLDRTQDATELVLAASIVWAVVLAVALLVIAPVLLTALDKRDIERRVVADPTMPRAPGEVEFVEAMRRRGLLFRFLVKEEGGSLSPTRRGTRLRERSLG